MDSVKGTIHMFFYFINFLGAQKIMWSANNVGPHVRQTFLNDVFTFLTEVGNAGRVVNTGTSSVNSEFVTAYCHVAGTVNKILNRNGFGEGSDTNQGCCVFLFY
jgi:hypothetical protein